MIGGPYVASVVFRPVKNCFISVPQLFLPLNRTNQIVIYKVQYDGDKYAYFSWSGDVLSPSSSSSFASADCSSGNSTIEINGLYALKLGLSENDQVLVTRVNGATPLECLSAEPFAVDDWEILELHTDYIQNNLLNQVRAVWKGQILPVWVDRNVCIFMRIGNLVPDCPIGFLEQFTEVHVSPKTRLFESASNSQGNSNGDTNSYNGTIVENDQTSGGDQKLNSFGTFSLSDSLRNTFRHWFPAVDDENSSDHLQNSVKYEEISDSQLTGLGDFKVPFRVHSLGRIQEILSEPCPCLRRFLIFSSDFNTHLFAQPTCVFILSASLPFRNDVNYFGRSLALAKIDKVLSPKEIAEMSQSQSKQKQNRGVGNYDKKTSKASSKETELARDSVGIKLVVLDVLLSRFDELCHNEACFASRMMRNMVLGAVYVSDLLRRQLGCNETSKVTVNFGVHSSQRPNSILLSPIQKVPADITKATIEAAVLRWLQSTCSPVCPLVISNGSLIELAVRSDLKIDFIIRTSELASHDSEDGPSLLTPLVKVDVQLEAIRNLNIPVITSPSVIGTKRAVLGGIDEVINRGLVFVTGCFGFGQLNRSLHKVSVITSDGGALLICGPQGSGKTTVAQTLCRELSDTKYRVYVDAVYCKALKGKRVESVAQVWKKTYLEALYRAPSIIFLDDLDHLTGASSGPEQEVGAAVSYQTRMSNALLDILKTVTWAASHNAPVVTIATCLSRNSLHPMLSSSRGVHLFQDILEIKNPTLEQRITMLQRLTLCKSMVLGNTLQNVDWHFLGSQTEGFVVRDLETLVDRAIHTAAGYSSSDSELLLSNDDFRNALQGLIPTSLRGLQSKSTWTKSWHDVGGLHAVKRVLIETLQWPVKYPMLFAKCPIPMRSGLLLYGPPGTGKTLLASVVAKECNMNFISIKGPELLSKYIGASEQSVRDLFQRASSAKPCIIFFDEFDSLASKRGHDSTGVTDRVVNQLLTQLDGVEGRQGVYVLAATSRPDLIDPALLRPGRLDKCICCPLPSIEDRTEILEALTQSLNLSSDVQLSEISAQCEHFSGADLQGLLSNAQLKAIHRIYPSVNGTSVKMETLSSKSSDEFCHLSNESVNNSSDSSNESVDVESLKEEDVAIFVPSLEDGIVTLDDAIIRERVKEQIKIISSNICNSETTMATIEVNEDSNLKSIVVTTEDILEALSDMKPSVSIKERQRYEAIYQNFLKSRGGHFGTEVLSGDKRATLA